MTQSGRLAALGPRPVPADTPTRIIGATIRALARTSPAQLSISDVCSEAGISRATFYRYFRDKEAVLSAISRHYGDEVSAVMMQAIAASPDPSLRMEVVLGAVAEFRQTNADLFEMIERAPGFTLGFLRELFPALVSVLAKALSPVLPPGALPASAAMQPEQLAELILRLLVSMLLLPGSDADEIPTVIASLWCVAGAGQVRA